ncbi:MAG: hypothetical protein MUC96_29675 [Myxococcaceae bacterium]|jgi:hypothetical protein|nr:hypothetical protein [Myxococcaceae bacterium]
MRIAVTFWMVVGLNGLGLLLVWLDGTACLALAATFGLVLLNLGIAFLSTLVVVLGLAFPRYAPRGSLSGRLIAGWGLPLLAAAIVALGISSVRWKGSCSSISRPKPAWASDDPVSRPAGPVATKVHLRFGPAPPSMARPSLAIEDVPSSPTCQRTARRYPFLATPRR